MIDAYEIGIQLLLQDDVSARLAVINRGLADVDRAIAATSANLAGLGQEAERVAKAVSAAVGGKIPHSVAVDTKSASPNADVPARAETGSTPPETRIAVEGASKRSVETPASPSTASLPDDGRAPQASPVPNAIERPAEASSPTKPVEREIIAPVQLDTTLSEKPAIDPPSRAVPSVASSPAGSRPRGDRNVATVASGSKQDPAAPSAAPAITASIRQLGRVDPSGSGKSSQVKARASDGPHSGPERAAVAPWSATERTKQQLPPVRLAERAMAPQGQARDRAEGGGGTIMLDGRLVGQWLSDHMGREASRPPGGTSFFDARQTPAWNVSGAL